MAGIEGTSIVLHYGGARDGFPTVRRFVAATFAQEPRLRCRNIGFGA